MEDVLCVEQHGASEDTVSSSSNTSLYAGRAPG